MWGMAPTMELAPSATFSCSLLVPFFSLRYPLLNISCLFLLYLSSFCLVLPFLLPSLPPCLSFCPYVSVSPSPRFPHFLSSSATRGHRERAGNCIPSGAIPMPALPCDSLTLSLQLQTRDCVDKCSLRLDIQLCHRPPGCYLALAAATSQAGGRHMAVGRHVQTPSCD